MINKPHLYEFLKDWLQKSFGGGGPSEKIAEKEVLKKNDKKISNKQ